jgi:NAD(P)-dependent dehydrogenase (short-subunit alcohol dehydrogenase family)
MGMLEGKTVAITGGGGGLGRCYGPALAAAGAKVAVSDIDLEAALETTHAINAAGGSAIAVEADASKAECFEHLFNVTEEELGPLDVLINLAGVFPKSGLAEMTEEHWDTVMTLNLKSVFLGSRAAVKRMLPRKRGVILSAASGTAARGSPRGSAYTASKAGIISFTRSVAIELRGSGVRINCFAPGPTDTPLWREGRNPADLQRVVESGQVYKPDDFSSVVVFLASDLSAPLNGEFVNRDLYR